MLHNDVYHKMWFKDLLGLKGEIDLTESSTPKQNRFRFGESSYVYNVRAMGVVIKITSTQSTMIYYLDDTTGILPVKYPTERLKVTPQKPVVGDLIEVLGQLNDGGKKANPFLKRFVFSKHIQIKKDPLVDTLRSLEIIQSYKDFYFKSLHLLDKHTVYTKGSIDDISDSTNQTNTFLSSAMDIDVETSILISSSGSGPSYSSCVPDVNLEAEPPQTDEVLNWLKSQNEPTFDDIQKHFSKLSNLTDILEYLEGEAYEIYKDKENKYCLI